MLAAAASADFQLSLAVKPEQALVVPDEALLPQHDMRPSIAEPATLVAITFMRSRNAPSSGLMVSYPIVMRQQPMALHAAVRSSRDAPPDRRQLSARPHTCLVLLQNLDDLLFRKTTALRVMVLIMGQNELQTGLSGRGNVCSGEQCKSMAPKHACIPN